tara:strand:- start:3124 stop:3825 length:702 start_codon:yes stop_codon:yes gene_type:complete
MPSLTVTPRASIDPRVNVKGDRATTYGYNRPMDDPGWIQKRDELSLYKTGRPKHVGGETAARPDVLTVKRDKAEVIFQNQLGTRGVGQGTGGENSARSEVPVEQLVENLKESRDVKGSASAIGHGNVAPRFKENPALELEPNTLRGAAKFAPSTGSRQQRATGMLPDAKQTPEAHPGRGKGFAYSRGAVTTQTPQLSSAFTESTTPFTRKTGVASESLNTMMLSAVDDGEGIL